MSFIIKGIDIPKTCRQCSCCADNGLVGVQRDYYCAALDCAPSVDDLDQKLTDCPLVEIPTPHGRLIDADRFLDWLEEFHQNDVVIMSGVKNARTVIEAEVNNEQRTKYAICRPYDGITLNTEVEFLFDHNGDVMLFDSESAAWEYLKPFGITEEGLNAIKVVEYKEVSE